MTLTTLRLAAFAVAFALRQRGGRSGIVIATVLGSLWTIYSALRIIGRERCKSRCRMSGFLVAADASSSNPAALREHTGVRSLHTRPRA